MSPPVATDEKKKKKNAGEDLRGLELTCRTARRVPMRTAEGEALGVRMKLEAETIERTGKADKRAMLEWIWTNQEGEMVEISVKTEKEIERNSETTATEERTTGSLPVNRHFTLWHLAHSPRP
mmetsp:Transcript_19850/g.28906  ORF Transcript_19850/g.28906 Transcript_19850/m.28906 type:complete len:123 (-) Transcript_19850:327-695(-)